MHRTLRKKALAVVAAQRDHQIRNGHMTSAWYEMDCLALCAGVLLLGTCGASIRPSERCDHGAVDFDFERERRQLVTDRISTMTFALAVGLVELERLLRLRDQQEGI